MDKAYETAQVSHREEHQFHSDHIKNEKQERIIETTVTLVNEFTDTTSRDGFCR